MVAFYILTYLSYVERGPSENYKLKNSCHHIDSNPQLSAHKSEEMTIVKKRLYVCTRLQERIINRSNNGRLHLVLKYVQK